MAHKNYNSGKYSGEWGHIRYVKKYCNAVIAWRFHGSKGPTINGHSSPVDVAWIDRQGNFYLDQVKYSNKKSKTKIPYISKDEINRLKDFAHEFIEAKNVSVRYVLKKAYKNPVVVNLTH